MINVQQCPAGWVIETGKHQQHITSISHLWQNIYSNCCNETHERDGVTVVILSSVMNADNMVWFLAGKDRERLLKIQKAFIIIEFLNKYTNVGWATILWDCHEILFRNTWTLQRDMKTCAYCSMTALKGIWQPFTHGNNSHHISLKHQKEVTLQVTQEIIMKLDH